MNIAFINFNKRWTGAKTMTVDYGRELLRLGHKVIMIIRKGTAHRSVYEAAGFTVYEVRLGMKYNPPTIYKLSKILTKNDIDISIVSLAKDLNIGATASKLAGIPVVHRVGLFKEIKNKLEDRALHKTIVDAVIVPNQFLKDELAEIKWFDTERVHVVPNSKPAADFPLAEKVNEGRIFGIKSRLEAEKGHDILIEAFAKVKQSVPDAKLYIAGTGKREKRIRKQIRLSGFEESVKFAGFVTDIPGFMSMLDICVLTSLNEGFGNTVIEAMFAGLPVISFDTGCVSEVLDGAGVLVPAGDADALAEKMIMLANDAEMRIKLGAAARARAEEGYELGKNTRRLVELLEQIISSR